MPRRPRAHSRARRATLAALGVVALVVVAGAADAAVVVGRMPQVAVRAPGSDDGTTWLVLGSDSRDRLTTSSKDLYADRAQSRGERADLVLLLRRDGSGRATLYSVPRDLYVGTERDRPHRLGLALQDGPQGVVDSLCQDLGIGVDHVVVADMDALVSAVDAVGGVTVRTQRPIRDRRARLDLPTPGEQRLDGRAALAWVRSRHPEQLVDGRWVPDPAADPSRSDHAEQVLGQVAAALDDPLTIQRVAWDAGPRVRRDDDLGPVGLARFGAALSEAVGARRTVTVPARYTTTAVPFAFPTDQTRATLEPLTSDSCRT
jgi:LCP family protein required for cell wall assembly